MKHPTPVRSAVALFTVLSSGFLLSCATNSIVLDPEAQAFQSGSRSGPTGSDNSVAGLPGGSSSNGPTTPGSPSTVPTSTPTQSGSSPYFAPRDNSQTFTAQLGGQTFSVYPHPRIWMTPASIAELRAKTVSTNPMWVGLQVSVDGGLGSIGNVADGGTLLNYAVAYVATGRSDYLQAAKTILLNFTNPNLYSIACDGSTYCGNDNIDYGSMDLMYIAAAFDWIYTGLSDTEKQTILNWVYQSFIPFLRLHPYYGDWVHNLGHTKWCGEFLWALATLGVDSRANALADSTYVFWRDRMLPILDEVLPGGHTYSGSGYGYNRVFKYQLYAFEAVYSALNLNMYDTHPWPIDEAYYRVHTTLPVDGLFFADWESAEGTYNQGRMNENEAILANRYRNSAAGKMVQYWVEHDFNPKAYYNQGGIRVNPLYVGLWFLWYDPNFAEEDYGQTQPTAYVADGLGLFLSREDWHDANSTHVALSSAQYVGDHQLHNEGSFKIFKKEHLVIENGRFYSGQNTNLTPTDTNILFIGNGQVQYSNVTGGLYRRDVGSEANISRFVANDAARLSYARADLTTAYEPNYFPLNYFHRNLVHLKSMNGSSFDYVIVMDRIQSQRAETKKLYVHVPEVPSLSGNLATMMSTNSLAKLGVYNLMPESTALTIDTVTDKSAGGYPQETSDHPARLTFTKTTAASQTDQFLAAYAMTDAVQSAIPSIQRVDSVDGLWTGAAVLDSGQNRVALFSKSNVASTGTIRYTVSKTTGVQHSVFDLPAGAKYDVSIQVGSNSETVEITPSAGGAFSADSQGVLIFED